MLDHSDLSFKEGLERSIVYLLNGDRDKPGLYRSILNCNDLETYQRIRATVFAYENVLDMMQKLIQQMNADEFESQQRTHVRGLNS